MDFNYSDSSAGSDYNQQSGADGDHGEQLQERKKTSLIVNYLPQTFLDKDLSDLFAPFGPIEHVRVMRDRNTGYSFGYGFVNYEKEEDAEKAIQNLNGLRVAENKTIKVTLARPPSDDIKDTNVYITNLPRDLTMDELLNMFSPFGDIVQKNLLYDKYTGLSRGVAFVRYDRREQAAAAIESMNNFIPRAGSEPIRVKLAENHGKQKAAYVQGFQSGFQQSRQHHGRDREQPSRYHHNTDNYNSHGSSYSSSSYYQNH